MKRLLQVTAIVLVLCRCLEAQVLPAETTTCSHPRGAIDDSPSSSPAFADDVRVQTPAGPGAWVLQVASHGGLGGAEGTELVVDSTGRLACYSTGLNCEQEFNIAILAHLDVMVRSATRSQWTRSVSAVCSDCVKTALVLRLRNAEGVEQIHTACWDPVTRSSGPDDAIEIYELIMEVAGWEGLVAPSATLRPKLSIPPNDAVQAYYVIHHNRVRDTVVCRSGHCGHLQRRQKPSSPASMSGYLVAHSTSEADATQSCSGSS